MLRNGNSGLKMGVSRTAHTQYAYIWKYPPPPPPRLQIQGGVYLCVNIGLFVKLYEMVTIIIALCVSFLSFSRSKPTTSSITTGSATTTTATVATRTTKQAKTISSCPTTTTTATAASNNNNNKWLTTVLRHRLVMDSSNQLQQLIHRGNHKLPIRINRCISNDSTTAATAADVWTTRCVQ